MKLYMVKIKEIIDKKVIVKRESQINEDPDEYRDPKLENKNSKKVRFSIDNDNEMDNIRNSSNRIGRDNTFRSMDSNQTDSNESD